jgi:hypothetical protein
MTMDRDNAETPRVHIAQKQIKEELDECDGAFPVDLMCSSSLRGFHRNEFAFIKQWFLSSGYDLAEFAFPHKFVVFLK